MDHSLYYRHVIPDAVPDGFQQVLDVGCGTGSLSRELLRFSEQVIGIDVDPRSIELARSHPQANGIEYVLGDFLDYPFDLASFDLITAVASLHHMDATAALSRMRELLRPGGRLAILGLARGSSPIDAVLAGVAVIADRIPRRGKAIRSDPHSSQAPDAGTYISPMVWPPPETYSGMRRLAERLLPGVRYRRHLLWRYSLVWTKPD
jgi:SAM-dependent methyltransferase